jgi:hypothetical protein
VETSTTARRALPWLDIACFSRTKGPRAISTEARVPRLDGKLLAHGTSTLLVLAEAR